MVSEREEQLESERASKTKVGLMKIIINHIRQEDRTVHSRTLMFVIIFRRPICLCLALYVVR